MLTSSRLFGVLLIAALSACSGSWTPAATHGPASTDAIRPHAAGTYLYAADGFTYQVDVFATSAKSPSRVISGASVYHPQSVAVAPDGTLFVANAITPTSSQGYISVYAPGSNAAKGRITKGIYGPERLAIDTKGVLYVANQGNDTAGNGWISEYSPSGILLRKITAGISKVAAMKVGPDGYLYAVSSTYNWITAYKPGSTQVARTYKGPTTNIFVADLALDGASNVYMLLQTQWTGEVVVYRAGTTHVLRKMSKNLVDSLKIAVDPSGHVYVGNIDGSVVCFPPGSIAPGIAVDNPQRTITALGIDPSNSLYVGTYGFDYTKGYNTGTIEKYSQGLHVHESTLTGKYDSAYFNSFAFGPN
jgi:hypothetical protein